jgi:hypothetical protein
MGPEYHQTFLAGGGTTPITYSIEKFQAKG